MILDKITAAKTFLIFSHGPTLALIIILGFIWWDRKTFYHAAIIMLLTGVTIATLKVTFKLPLPATLGISGFGFPSGHMLQSTVLYTLIAHKAKNTIVAILISILLLAIGCSLVYMGYHYYGDILGAIFFALLLVICYEFCCVKSAENAPSLALIAATTMVFYLYHNNLQTPFYVWRDYYSLFGLAIGSKISKSTSGLKTLLQKVLCSLFWVALILALSLYLQKMLWQGTPRTRAQEITENDNPALLNKPFP